MPGPGERYRRFVAWDPDLYLRFGGPRLRPAADLLARVPPVEAREVVDLGCGTGNVTRLLAERWPGARVVGVDSSPEMLARAKAELPELRWVEGDVAVWEPAGPVDVVASNATLHWLDDHETLLSRFAGWLRPGGVLAIQMPASFDEPSHVEAFEVARTGPWSGKYDRLRARPVADPRQYVTWLSAHVEDLDVWTSTYVHLLEGDDPVVEWTSATLLRPLLGPLDGAEREEFLRRYRERMAAAYPALGNGRTPFPFRRLFIVARRR